MLWVAGSVSSNPLLDLKQQTLAFLQQQIPHTIHAAMIKLRPARFAKSFFDPTTFAIGYNQFLLLTIALKYNDGICQLTLIIFGVHYGPPNDNFLFRRTVFCYPYIFGKSSCNLIFSPVSTFKQHYNIIIWMMSDNKITLRRSQSPKNFQFHTAQ